MCGICGTLHTGKAAAPADPSLVGQMTAVLAHRGPNDSGTYVHGRIALGHRRLSVIDLTRNGRQPMSNEDQSVWIVFNGEIYNFRELKRSFRLAEKRHVF